MQILFVEDDIALAEAVTESLQNKDFVVNHVAKGSLAISSIKVDLPDIVILDLGLPDMDGTEVLKIIRKHSAEIPILILTARTSIEDKVLGLDLGADDYLAKPFEVDELLARLRVFERRASTSKHADLTIDNVTIDVVSHQVTIDDAEIDLSRREFMVLKALMENAGRVQTRDKLESKLYSWGEEVASNTIEVHIHHLRKKLPQNFIQTLRGIGYIIKSP